MKILYSCLSQSWGGMEMFTIDAVLLLLKRGIHTELICYPASKIDLAAKERGIITHSVKAKGYFEPSAIFKIKKIISMGNFDLVHTQASKDLWSLVPALNLSRKKIPLVITKQMGSFVVKKDYLHRRLYSRVDKAFAISKVIEKNLIETTPLSPEKITILHNGVDIKSFAPDNKNRKKIRTEFNITEEELLFGMTARFTPGKGHEEFLKAAKTISDRFNNVRFLVVGEPSRGETAYAQKIYELSKDYKLENRLIFTGYRNDIPDILSALDVFVFPSHAEAFGISLAEAMAAGKACVASGSDGPLDIIDDELNGLFFETGNAADLTNKLILLINNPSLRNRLSEQARIKARRDFDIEKLTDKVIVHYEKLIKKKGV